MLLTCKSCGNTYVIDDAEWASADGDGKICEQCQEPLVPLVAGGAQQDSTTILEGYSFDGIQSSLRDGSGGAMPMEPQGYGAADGDPYGGGGGDPWQSPSGSMSASVPMPPEHGSMAQPPPGYGAPPSYNPPSGPPGGAGFGPPPGMGGGYGPPPGMNDPYGGGGQAPMPTQALDGLGAGAPPMPGGGGNEQYIGSNESTMALDLDDLRSDAAPAAPLPATQALDPVHGPPGNANERTGALDTSSLQRKRGRKQVIIGGGGGGGAPGHEDRTAAIDLNQASAYAAQMQSATPGPGGWGNNPAMQAGAAQPQRPRQIPGVRPQPQTPLQTGSGGGSVLKVVLIVFLVVLLIGGAVGAALFLLGGDERKSSASGGDESTDSQPLTFEEKLAEARAATTLLLPPISGALPTDGQIVLASAADGAYVGRDLIVPFSGQKAPAEQLENGFYLPALVTALDQADATLPIVVLLDSSLTLEAAFPLLYTAGSTGRQVFVGGSTVENPNSVGTVELNPWEWPAPPAGEFASPTRKTELRILVSSDEIKLLGKGVNDGGEGDPNSLTLTWFELSKLPSSLASAKSANSELEAVRLAPSPSLTVGKLIEAVQVVRGENYDLPRFKTLYLEVPK